MTFGSSSGLGARPGSPPCEPRAPRRARDCDDAQGLPRVIAGGGRLTVFVAMSVDMRVTRDRGDGPGVKICRLAVEGVEG